MYTGASPTCELKSLQPATFYYLRVQAINPAGPGPFSEVETCKTPPSSPEAVPTLRLLSSTSDSLLIQWLEPSNCGEEIIAYNIDIGEAQPLAVGNVTEYCIDQLQPDTKYRWVTHYFVVINSSSWNFVLVAMFYEMEKSDEGKLWLKQLDYVKWHKAWKWWVINEIIYWIWEVLLHVFNQKTDKWSFWCTGCLKKKYGEAN